MNNLLLFAKAPRLGTVKTRLAQTMGAESALRVYLSLLKELAAQLQEVRTVTVCFAPADGESELRAVLPNYWSYRRQCGSTLGERLHHAFSVALTNGAERLAAIGADCPDLVLADIHEAWRRLDDHDVVFGPAEDGGYWLIGMRELHPKLFDGIPWSTASVLDESLARTREFGLKVAMLRTLRDIDTEADWQWYLDSKRKG